MGWLIALGVVTLLAVLPLGASVRYDAAGLVAKIILGPLKITVFPLPKKEKKEKKKKPEPAQKPEEPKKPAPKAPQNPPPPPEEKPKEDKGGKLTDFLPLIKVALDLLNSLRRKLRVDVLEAKLILAGGDPCDLAVNYGRAWAAVGNLMPQLERFLVIKKRNVEVECDFTASETLITARLDITITLGRLLALVTVFGIRAVKEFLKIKKQRKGGANP
ncbi:MAG: DUF2953 domain-containing protein [Oscillospiraceae bacterium]|nr:DUF2953 domain-containing protein [Oscillospiraceae bacterium]